MTVGEKAKKYAKKIIVPKTETALAMKQIYGQLNIGFIRLI